MKIKLIALLVLAALLIPMTFACGEKAENDDSSSKATEAAGETSTTTAAPTNPPTTPEPTEPPTTAEPTEPFIVDSSMTYWEQIEAELAFYGFSGGTKCFTGETEEELMKKLNVNNTKKELLDLSGDDSVPFSIAYKVWTTKEVDNFWEAGYSVALTKDIPTEPDDLIAGVFWIKGWRERESEWYDPGDFAQYYLAIKTSTDNWGSEGDVEPRGEQFAEEEWVKVFFTGRVVNEEKNSSSLGWNIYMGYGLQEFEIGGAIAFHFPSTPENEKAALFLVD